MVFASICERLFLRARAVNKFALRAANTLENTDGEQRALRKYSRQNLDLSLRNALRQVIWLTSFHQSQQLTANYALLEDVKLRQVASKEPQCGTLAS